MRDRAVHSSTLEMNKFKIRAEREYQIADINAKVFCETQNSNFRTISATRRVNRFHFQETQPYDTFSTFKDSVITENIKGKYGFSSYEKPQNVLSWINECQRANNRRNALKLMMEKYENTYG